MTAELTERHLAYLSYPHYAIVATLRNDGSPQLSTVWFDITDDRQGIMFVIERDSLKARNFQRDPRIAISIPHGGRYVALEGLAEFDLNQDPAAAQQDLERIGRRYYGPVEGPNQVASFGDKIRLTIYLRPTKVNSVGV